MSEWTDDEMLDGYRDGRTPGSPAPGLNRSNSYRHGFANGRDDLIGLPRAPAWMLRIMADEARAADGGLASAAARPAVHEPEER